jgi:hypothetical protein
MIRFGRALCAVIVSIVGATCFAQAPITNGLAARWSGDGDAKDSAGHCDAQVSGGLRYAPGPAAAQAFQFNGSAAKVDFGNTAGNFGTRDFTVALWMKTESKDRVGAFLNKRPTCDAGHPFWDIRIGRPPAPPGFVFIALSDGGYREPYFLVSSHALNDSQWHHVAWVRQSTSSGSNTGLIYVDGALDNSVDYPVTIDVANQSPLVMGQDVCQCCDGTRPYSGAAAELQLFSHALSAEEILTLYKAEKSNK